MLLIHLNQSFKLRISNIGGIAKLSASRLYSNGKDVDLNHLIGKESRIHPYWIEKLNAIEKPAAVDLISQLTSKNSLGYMKSNGEAAKSGTMVSSVMEEKEKHIDKVILFRCGNMT